MPRQARIDAPGALHHIMCRGIERRPIVRDDVDRDAFVTRLGQVLLATGTPCYAWALLPNHLHLLLRTGRAPLTTVMRRLLTGYAGAYNRRHHRQGYVFQNRYKSILCQEEPYFLELVRYIHLSPIRLQVVSSVAALERYPYTGHQALLGKTAVPWQDTAGVLAQFARRAATARARYREFVAEGLTQGRRRELTGGGLLRSAGGWTALGALRRQDRPVQGDERILGASEFVEAVLLAAREERERRDRLRAHGYDLDKLVRRVATRYALTPAEMLRPSRAPRRLEARSLLCYWAVRELGLSGTAVAGHLGVSQPAVSRAVARGERLAVKRGLRLLEDGNA